jgi:hypothetical protein
MSFSFSARDRKTKKISSSLWCGLLVTHFFSLTLLSRSNTQSRLYPFAQEAEELADLQIAGQLAKSKELAQS